MDPEKVGRTLFQTATKTMSDLEDQLGEFSTEQKRHVVSSLISFWAGHEDHYHPLPSGEKWHKAILRTCKYLIVVMKRK